MHTLLKLRLYHEDILIKNPLRYLHDEIYSMTDSLVGSDEEKIKRVLEVFKEIKEEIIGTTIKDLKESSPDNLKKHRDNDNDYLDKLFLQWEQAFNHLEMMWHFAAELGESHGHDVKENDKEADNEMMAALANIFPRSLLVVREIISLLKSGFPDGAIARWRSLHELSITAMYIAKHKKEVASQYLLSLHISAYRAALQLNDHSEKTGMQPFTPKEINQLKCNSTKAKTYLGLGHKKDSELEWPKITGKNTFFDLEKDVGMEAWRPWYKWASNYIHSNHRHFSDLVAISNSNRQAHLIGPSNQGYIDPFQLTAQTLSQLVTTYLGLAPTLDRLIHIEVFNELAKEMSEIALNAHNAKV